MQGLKDGGSSSGTLGYQSRGSFTANTTTSTTNHHPTFNNQNNHTISSSSKNSFNNINTNNSLIQRQIEDQAWNIYLFFVAKGAVYEILLSPKNKDDIMRKLACPEFDMFNTLEAAAKLELDIIFDGYKRNSKQPYNPPAVLSFVIGSCHCLLVCYAPFLFTFWHPPFPLLPLSSLFPHFPQLPSPPTPLGKESYVTWESRAVKIAENIIKIEEQGGNAGRLRRWFKNIGNNIISISYHSHYLWHTHLPAHPTYPVTHLPLIPFVLTHYPLSALILTPIDLIWTGKGAAGQKIVATWTG